jgi:hypothetical protein
MNQTIRSRQFFTVNVIAASPTASPALLSIVGTLGIDPGQAADRLSSLPAVLAENVSAQEARRMSALLGAFGFRVRLDPVSVFQKIGRASGQRRDLSLQPLRTFDPQAGIRRLVQVTGRGEAEVTAGLAGPEGLVLRDLDDRALAPLQRALRSVATVRMVLSDPLTAVYDAFRTALPLPVADLSRLGLARCAFSGAVAAEMNQATARHLAQRAGAGLAIHNRDFLRFDLYLASASGFGTELAAFLESRSRIRGLESTGDQPLIDSDLPHGVARQFISDYSAIGLKVQARLRFRTR